MGEISPATRFRITGRNVLAAGTLFLSVAVMAAGSFGLLTPEDVSSDESARRVDHVSLEALGASGILPESSELSIRSVIPIGNARELQAEVPGGPLAIPAIALAAYQRAQAILALDSPNCDVSWTLLAGLGRVISDDGGGLLGPDGTTSVPILGPRLNGLPGIAEIPDSDDARLDGDLDWDRAAGPMQIIPVVWSRVGADADGNGTANPHNVFDAALAAGRYLCAAGVSLGEDADRARAVFSYQRSNMFVRAVLAWSRGYEARMTVPPAAPDSAPVAPLPPVESVLPLPATPPPPGSLPPGLARAPISALRPGTGTPNDRVPVLAAPAPGTSGPPPSSLVRTALPPPPPRSEGPDPTPTPTPTPTEEETTPTPTEEETTPTPTEEETTPTPTEGRTREDTP